MLVFDNNLVTAADITHRHWPIVMITNPKVREQGYGGFFNTFFASIYMKCIVLRAYVRSINSSLSPRKLIVLGCTPAFSAQ